jgi:hypothetical protein
MTEQIDDDDLERFLGPLLAEWNQLKPVEIRALRAAPLAADASVAVTLPVRRDWIPCYFQQAKAGPVPTTDL